MSDQVQLDVEHSGLIPARDSQIGEKYRSRTDLPVIVKEKREDQVLVRSLITGNDVTIPMDYPLSLTDEGQARMDAGQEHMEVVDRRTVIVDKPDDE